MLPLELSNIAFAATKTAAAHAFAIAMSCFPLSFYLMDLPSIIVNDWPIDWGCSLVRLVLWQILGQRG
jgi:hypothetical protein